MSEEMVSSRDLVVRDKGSGNPSGVLNEELRQAMGRLLSYHTASMQGIGKRDEQEDDFRLVNSMDVMEAKRNGMLVAVADGMGGMEGGKVASSTTTCILVNGFADMDRSSGLDTGMKKIIAEANRQVYELLSNRGGSTLVVCVFFDEKLYFYSVGDSFLYLFRNFDFFF